MPMPKWLSDWLHTRSMPHFWKCGVSQLLMDVKTGLTPEIQIFQPYNARHIWLVYPHGFFAVTNPDHQFGSTFLLMWLVTKKGYLKAVTSDWPPPIFPSFWISAYDNVEEKAILEILFVPLTPLTILLISVSRVVWNCPCVLSQGYKPFKKVLVNIQLGYIAFRHSPSHY